MIKQVEINDSQFDALVLKSALPVVLEFSSPECIICKTMASRIQEVGEEFASQVIFLRMNINENKRWQEFGVRVIPTLAYFKSGILQGRQDNFPEAKDIHKQIAALVSSS